MLLDPIARSLAVVLLVLIGMMCGLGWWHWPLTYTNDLALSHLLTLATTLAVSVVVTNVVTRAAESRRTNREAFMAPVAGLERTLDRALELYSKSSASPLKREECQQILADLKSSSILVRELTDAVTSSTLKRHCRAVHAAIRMIKTQICEASSFPSEAFRADPVQLALTQRNHAQAVIAIAILRKDL